MEKDKNIINKIKKCFDLYNSHLINREFLIIYKLKDEFNILNLQFKKENFLHLTGIEKIKPLKFYAKLNDKTLKMKDIEIGQYSNIKLSVFPEMINIFKEKSKIGTYDQNNKFHKNLSIDQGMALSIPKSNAVLGIRYIKEDETVPVSLLKQKLKKISQKDTITDIVCMFEKNVKEEQYNKIVYNTIDIQEILKNNKELEKILTSDLLKEIYPEKENGKTEEKTEINENESSNIEVNENETEKIEIQENKEEILNEEKDKKVTIEKNDEISKEKAEVKEEKTKLEKEKPKREKRSRSRGNER